MKLDTTASRNTYFIDSENGAEAPRLLDQNRLLTKYFGGLFLESIDVSTLYDVLDLACGPGGWVQDVAYLLPEAQVVGVDISESMVKYARAMAHVQWLDNARFQVMDLHQQLDFPDASFDLVNARLLQGCVPKTAWPTLLRECCRITKPEGAIQLAECDAAITNSKAINALSNIYTRALHVAGYSFSCDGQPVAITKMLAPLLEEAGYQCMQEEAYLIDFSAGTENYVSFFRDFQVFVELLKPFFLKMEVTTQEEIDRLYEQMLLDMYSDDFRGIWPFLRIVGRKAA